MLEILESPKHVVALRLSGELTAADIETAYKATDEALKHGDRVSFFAEIDPSMQLTFEGVAKDIVEGVRQWGKLMKYYRAAIVTDKGWLSAMARVEGIVFSSIDVRVFGHAERDKAFAWAVEAPKPVTTPAEPEASIHFLQTTSENVFAYEIDGRLRAAGEVGVFDTEQELPAGVPGEQPVEQGGAGPADVEIAGGAGGEAGADHDAILRVRQHPPLW